MDLLGRGEKSDWSGRNMENNCGNPQNLTRRAKYSNPNDL